MVDVTGIYVFRVCFGDAIWRAMEGGAEEEKLGIRPGLNLRNLAISIGKLNPTFRGWEERKKWQNIDKYFEYTFITSRAIKPRSN